MPGPFEIFAYLTAQAFSLDATPHPKERDVLEYHVWYMYRKLQYIIQQKDVH